MSPEASATAAKPAVVSPQRLTVADVRRKADRIQQIAREDVEHVMKADGTRLVVGAAIGVAVVVGLAYYLGTRAGRHSSRRVVRAAPPA